MTTDLALTTFYIETKLQQNKLKTNKCTEKGEHLPFLFVCRCIQISVVHEEDESSRSVCSLETGMVTDYFSGINLNAEIKNHELYSFIFQT